LKRKYLVEGYVPVLDYYIREYIWEYSEQQALKIINERVRNRPKFRNLVVPPLGLHCQVKDITLKVSQSV